MKSCRFMLAPEIRRSIVTAQIGVLKGLTQCPLWVTCGRRLGKDFFDVVAALVGCGHVSGLLMRRMWPLALMLCADRIPIVSTHFKVR
jgi:hypothetical protein